jgi:hypothetical protein
MPGLDPYHITDKLDDANLDATKCESCVRWRQW